MRKFILFLALAAAVTANAGELPDSNENQSFRWRSPQFSVGAGIGMTQGNAGFETLGLSYFAGGYATLLYQKADGLGFGIRGGAELRQTSYKRESYLGGLIGSVDFKEQFNYQLTHLSIPVGLAISLPKEWGCLFLGPAVNIPLAGTTKYKRISQDMQGVDDTSKSKINNLVTCVSFRASYDMEITERIGFMAGLDLMVGPFKNHEDAVVNTFWLGISYRF